LGMGITLPVKYFVFNSLGRLPYYPLSHNSSKEGNMVDLPEVSLGHDLLS